MLFGHPAATVPTLVDRCAIYWAARVPATTVGTPHEYARKKESHEHRTDHSFFCASGYLILEKRSKKTFEENFF